ncbi:Uma2 family endonuclease [Sphingomonas sp. RS2018]
MNDPAHLIEAERPARFSVEEFMAMAPALEQLPGKVELVDGVIVRKTSASYSHFSIQRQLFLKLHAIFGEGINGFIVGQELTVRLGEATVRDPDIAVFRDPGMISGIPDRDVLLLTAEVSKTWLREDLGPKRLTYAAAGVPEYWVVDVNARRVHRFTGPVDGDYRQEEVVAFGAPLPVPGTDETIRLD